MPDRSGHPYRTPCPPPPVPPWPRWWWLWRYFGALALSVVMAYAGAEAAREHGAAAGVPFGFLVIVWFFTIAVEAWSYRRRFRGERWEP